MKQEIMGFWDGGGISWTMCKQSSPCSRQIATPTPRHSVFIGQMFFLMPSQQCQSTEVKPLEVFNYFKYETVFNTIILYPFNASV